MLEDDKKSKGLDLPEMEEEMKPINNGFNGKGFSGFQRRTRIGDALVTSGKINEAQLTKALEEQKKSKERIGRVLVSMNMVTEDDIVDVLKKQLGLEIFSFKDKVIPNEVLDLVPATVARKHLVVPIDAVNDKLKLAMADPINVFAIDDVKIITGMNIIPFIAKEEDVRMAINRYYPDTGLDDIIKTISDERVSTIAADEDSEVTFAGTDEGPVMRIVNSLISEAFKQGASDIHVEPRQDFVIVRFRVDGILREQMKLPRNLRYAIASRFKVMSSMDIAEKRVPQDGRIQLVIENEELDLRVSTLPTIYGEKVVCRLLIKKGAKTQLEQLGFLPENLEQWKLLLDKPYGIILVTGPTGSGKTRTLYSSLNKINDPALNIITVEDPVEYRLDGINQVQTTPRRG
ncbi:MAG TPA: ATPase, T2SS/T4P/T4SS family [Bacillota bacterium]|nr:ATPase, T2SS/T4P/T4SS family [Bacillota bacterium]